MENSNKRNNNEINSELIKFKNYKEFIDKANKLELKKEDEVYYIEEIDKKSPLKLIIFFGIAIFISLFI